MPKPRTKRKDVREERKRKHQNDAQEAPHDEQSLKRQRREGEEEGEGEGDNEGDNEGENKAGNETADFYFDTPQQQANAGEPQFFGMLTDEEQEYFRSTAEVLELNDFPAPEDRAMFVENVFKEAEGKEMKLVCSQSCSRLMERLILLSSARQKKHLFEALAGNFLALVQHRFASHCCEMLFLQAAPVVGEELAGHVSDVKEDEDGDQAEKKNGDEKPEASMEDLFLLTLDELEADLSFLLTQTYASHTLRALLLILSGKPLEDATMSSLLKSKRKERISVPGAAAPGQDESGQQPREVPESFAMAVQKIISDVIMALDSSGLKILVTHPTGNPILQLLLELDITYNAKSKKAKDDSDETETLLSRLIPGAPASLKDESSKAYEFVTGMIYDQIGSRLLETLIAHAPGKTFKAIYQTIFAKRMQSYVRNEVASYPAIKVLIRLGKEDLVACVGEIVPVIPALVEKSRFNVIKTLLERCSARDATEQIDSIVQALLKVCGGRAEDLIPKLCLLREDANASKEKGVPQYLTRNQNALISHGSQLISTILSVPTAAKIAQTSLLSLTSEELLGLATGSTPTMFIIKTALSKPSPSPIFHKLLVAALLPHVPDLATSQIGHNIVNEMFTIPARGKERSVPFHLKEAVMAKLAEKEDVLRESWAGRSVWRTWKGDVWKRGRAGWGVFAKEAVTGAEAGDAFAAAPTSRSKRDERPPANHHIARRFQRQAERKAERAKKHAWEEGERARAWEERKSRFGAGEETGDAANEVEGEVQADAVEGGAAVEKVDGETKPAEDGAGEDEERRARKKERKEKRNKKDKPETEEGVEETSKEKEERRARRKEKREKKERKEKSKETAVEA